MTLKFLPQTSVSDAVHEFTVELIHTYKYKFIQSSIIFFRFPGRILRRKWRLHGNSFHTDYDGKSESEDLSSGMALRISNNILPRSGGKHSDDSGYEEKTSQEKHNSRLSHSFGRSRHVGTSLEDTGRIFRSFRRGHIQRYKQVGFSSVECW